MSTNIPTGNGRVSESEPQQLRPKSKGSRSKESQIDDTDDYYGIKAMRKKLTLDFETELNTMRNKIFGKNEKAKEKQLLASSTIVATDGYPWELRSKTNATMGKLCIELSESEIEEDFIKMVGHPPPRKPNKRANMVQNRLSALFPGMSLTKIKPDSYKVHEFIVPESTKAKKKNKSNI
ncbi:hypothetical protein TSUD_394120 [Trifolium subterraneum]|uniref:Uncharacterized protein n=1 Tax=Trifolium subterraneum TaxID=3900 RepID=A0A2Z6MTD3_TRISU|nr:hypothetical protein TSUD_394120 [Trifolium subterraneum]